MLVPSMHHTAFMCFAICLLLSCAAPRATAQSGARQPDTGHDFYIYAGVGASNGARLGLMHQFLPHLAGEVSFGYVRLLNYFTIRGHPSESTGLTPSVGITYMTSSDRANYGTASLLLSYQIGTEKVVFQHERRLVITAAIGSEFAIIGRLSGQVRLGPTAHIMLAPVRGPVQLLMHYDGSIGWRL
jgi:hypothetical protein